MSVKVVLSIGEDYPHLFVSADADEIRHAESAAALELLRPPVVAELSDEDWAGYCAAADAYYAWIGKLDQMRTRGASRA